MKIRIAIAVVASILIAYLIYLLVSMPKEAKKPEKIFNRYISYSEKTYNPYDTKFVYDSFKEQAKNGYDLNLKKPSYENDVIVEEDSNAVLAIVSPHFLPTVNETTLLQNYVSAGNNVYISAFNIAPNFIDSLIYPAESTTFFDNYPPIPYDKDSMDINWLYYNESYTLDSTVRFSYPGVQAATYYQNPFDLDSSDQVYQIAYDGDSSSSLVQVPYGNGSFYIQLRPISMANYFLLHKNNYRYLNTIFKELGLDKRKVIWDSFYKTRKNVVENEDEDEPEDSYLWDLIKKNKPLRWSVFTFFASILLFLLLYSRRMQAPMRIIPDVKNSSVEFSTAISGLYWINQDHKNIAEKIILQVYDYLTVNYKIYPREFNASNLKKIAQKTDKPEREISQMLDQIEEISGAESINKQRLIDFYSKAFAFMK